MEFEFARDIPCFDPGGQTYCDLYRYVGTENSRSIDRSDERCQERGGAGSGEQDTKDRRSRLIEDFGEVEQERRDSVNLQSEGILANLRARKSRLREKRNSRVSR